MDFFVDCLLDYFSSIVFLWYPGVRLKIAFCQLCVPLCGRFGPDEGGVAGYVMSDPEFGVEKFCTELNMSKASLYRKLRATTGQSINEFIQNIRLKYAARILIETDKNISEIAYEVGFSDPYYFSRAFKKCFAQSPQHWRDSKSS